MRVTLHAFVTLDGVVQAPGSPQEDTEGGFEHGGWSFPYSDEEGGATMVGWMAKAEAFLLGRRTYDIFAGYWPKVTDPANPIATQLNTLPKYVASRSRPTLGWDNSSLLGPDLLAALGELKARPGGELQVHGSGGLAQTLIEHDLIDEYRLLTFPVHLGSGRRLFGDGLGSAALRLTAARSTGQGVLIATYEPDGPVRVGSFDLEP